VIRDLTKQLIQCLLLDTWPGNAACVDFGVASPAHLGALQFAFKQGGRSAEDFDAALGSGKALTELCNVPDQPYKVKFETAWDQLGPEEE